MAYCDYYSGRRHGRGYGCYGITGPSLSEPTESPSPSATENLTGLSYATAASGQSRAARAARVGAGAPPSASVGLFRPGSDGRTRIW